MVFNTVEFFLFLIVVFSLHWVSPARWRWVLLLAASYYFYMCWNPAYVVLILLSTFIDYSAALAMSKTRHTIWRNVWLAASLSGNLGMLFAFKYYNFFNESLASITGLAGEPLSFPASDLLLPVGISFYTFQSLSYTIDVYRRTIKPERHFGIFALYVSFFPQLVAGPIERSETLLPQFRERKEFDYTSAASGLRLILWGLFKKVVIADRLAIVVNHVYNDPGSHSGPAYCLATLFFAYQIYCDFSGYSDMAIGTARLLGYNLMTNFDRPYQADSFSGFWRRWHISLSTWFRDYVYVPLGGNRVSTPRWFSNLMITFLISGLWHGASWTFVIWGALHGTFLLTEQLLRKPFHTMLTRCGIDPGAQWLAFVRTPLVFAGVCFAWIFFRANSLADAVHIAGNLHAGWMLSALTDSQLLREAAWSLGSSRTELLYSLLLIGFLEVAQWGAGRFPEVIQIDRMPAPVRWGLYYAAVSAIFFWGQFGDPGFIYFQF